MLPQEPVTEHQKGIQYVSSFSIVICFKRTDHTIVKKSWQDSAFAPFDVCAYIGIWLKSIIRLLISSALCTFTTTSSCSNCQCKGGFSWSPNNLKNLKEEGHRLADFSFKKGSTSKLGEEKTYLKKNRQ